MLQNLYVFIGFWLNLMCSLELPLEWVGAFYISEQGRFAMFHSNLLDGWLDPELYLEYII